MSDVSWDTMALIGSGEITVYETLTSVAKESYGWSLVRTPFTMTGFNILSKSLLIYSILLQTKMF